MRTDSNLTRALLALSVFCLTANRLDAHAADPTAPERGRADRVNRQAVATRPGGVVQFDLASGGEIRVVGWDRDSVAVTSETRGSCPPVEVTTRGSGVQIRTVERRGWSGCDLHLMVKVPMRYNIEIDSKGGAVAISEVEGRFSGRTMGGGLTLDRLRGTLDLSTMGGEIRLSQSDVDGKVSTMGGSVKLIDVTGDVKATTMGGSVSRTNVTNRRGERQDGQRSASGETRSTDRNGVIRISTMGGEINLSDAPAGANLSTMGGAIHVGRSGGSVSASTMGGDIRIDEVDGAIRANTMGGDITATMIGDPATGDRSVDLSSLRGDVTLTIPAGLSVDLEAQLTSKGDDDATYQIVSDIPLTQRTEQDQRDSDQQTVVATGSVGGGKHRVRLRTINGNITLRFAR